MTIDFCLFGKTIILKKGDYSGKNIQINNPKSLGNINYIESCFIDEISVLDGKIELSNFIFNGEKVVINHLQKVTLKQYFEENPFTQSLDPKLIVSQNSFSILEIPGEPEHYYPISSSSTEKNELLPTINSQKHQNTLNLKSFLQEDIKDDPFLNQKYTLHYAMKTLMLCHNTKTGYNTKNDTFIHDTKFKVHEKVLSYVSELGLFFDGNVKFFDNNLSSYKLKFGSSIFYYLVVSINDYTKPRNRFSIIFSEKKKIEDSEEFHLFVCSYDYETFHPKLKMNSFQRENLNDSIDGHKKLGMISLIYATRTLKKEEIDSFLLQKKNINLENYENYEKLDSLYDSIEKDLDIVIIMNYKHHLKENAFENIATLKDARMRLFFLSSNCEISAVSSAYGSGLIDKTAKIKKIMAKNNKTAVLLLKNFLNTLKKEYDSNISLSLIRKDQHSENQSPGYFLRNSNQNILFTLVLDGQTLEYILKNEYLKENFKFILIWTQNLICVKMKDDQKFHLIKYIKACSARLSSKTMSITSTYDGLSMSLAADISFEINEKENYISQGQNDFNINTFEKLANLILVKGPSIDQKIKKVIICFLFNMEMILFLRFFNEFLSNFSYSELFSDQIIYLDCIIFMITSIFFFLFSKAPKISEILELFPIVYKGNAFKKKHLVLNLILETILPSLLVCICILSTELIYSQENDMGVGRSFDFIQSHLFLTILIISQFMVLFQYLKF